MRLNKAFLCFFAFFLAHCGLAELPPDHSWQAQWIGVALPVQVDLSGASWIWADESGVDPARNAPAGARFFCRTVDVPTNQPILSATALFCADNHFKLAINGKNVGNGDDWQHPVHIDITSALHPGLNRVLVQADNDSDEGAINAAGLIGKIRIECADHSIQEITTGAGWKSSVGSETFGLETCEGAGRRGDCPLVSHSHPS